MALFSQSPEMIQKRVATRKRNGSYAHSEETKRKIGAGNKGKVVSQETRDKISKGNTGKKRTPEQCNNIRLAHLAKKPMSKKAKRNMSKGQTGKKHTEQGVHNIRMSNTAAVRKKKGDANRGRVKTKDERLALSVAQRKRWRLYKLALAREQQRIIEQKRDYKIYRKYDGSYCVRIIKGTKAYSAGTWDSLPRAFEARNRAWVRLFGQHYEA